MAEGYASANQAAAQVINGELPAVAAENANYGAYQVDAAGVDTSFSLQDEGTVSTLLSGSSAYLPEASVAAAADIAWNRKGIQSAVTQGILLGESIPKIASRMQSVGAQNRAQAVRWARTYTTAAENAGRVASYERARKMGIKLKQEWLATLDGRTRHSHRQLDSERREVGKRFSNGCRYPGDPQAAYAEICNCRCTLVAAVDGIDQGTADRFSRLPSGTTYEQWKAGKAEAGTNSSVATSDAKPSVWQRIKNAVKDYADAQRVYGLTAPGFRPRPRKTVQLPEDEYAAVMSAIGTNYNGRFKGKSGGSMAVGDYVYRFEVEEPGVYRIVGKRKIEGL